MDLANTNPNSKWLSRLLADGYQSGELAFWDGIRPAESSEGMPQSRYMGDA